MALKPAVWKRCSRAVCEPMGLVPTKGSRPLWVVPGFRWVLSGVSNDPKPDEGGCLMVGGKMLGIDSTWSLTHMNEQRNGEGRMYLRTVEDEVVEDLQLAVRNVEFDERRLLEWIAYRPINVLYDTTGVARLLLGDVPGAIEAFMWWYQYRNKGRTEAQLEEDPWDPHIRDLGLMLQQGRAAEVFERLDAQAKVEAAEFGYERAPRSQDPFWPR